MIGNDGGGDKEMVRSSGGRSFQRRGAVMDMVRLENMRWFNDRIPVSSVPRATVSTLKPKKA